MINNHQKRIGIFKEIDQLCSRIVVYKQGTKRALAFEIKSTRNFWLNFFGFETLAEMNLEDLQNFRSLLKAKVEAEFKLKAFPLFHGKAT